MADEYGTYISGLSPYAWWRHDEASGTTLADSSGGGHTGTLSGTAPAYEAAGLATALNQSINYNATVFSAGSGTYTTTGAFTTWIWCKFNQASRTEGLIATNFSGSEFGYSGVWGLYRSGSDLVNWFGKSGADAYIQTSSVCTNDGVFHRYGCWSDGSSFKSIIDDTITSTNSVPSGFSPVNDDIAVGTWDTDSGFFTSRSNIDAYVTEFVWWNRALTVDEIVPPAVTARERTKTGVGV